MAQVEKEIDVAVPVRTAYNQWTQFELFPRFMDGVESVEQLSDRRLHWRAKVAGRSKEWEATIKEQVPDERIIWTSDEGDFNAGMVSFRPIDPDHTTVRLQMSYDPEGVIESAGDSLGFMSRRVQGNLERFRDFVEALGQETGGYRETLENPKAPGGHTRAAT